MKISLKLNIDHLRALNEMMADLDTLQFAGQPRKMKSIISICIELRESLLKTEINKRFATKAFKVNLPYYKADALLHYLEYYDSNFKLFPDNYKGNVLRMIFNDLHQKLL